VKSARQFQMPGYDNIPRNPGLAFDPSVPPMRPIPAGEFEPQTVLGAG
jgi:hypothetical protein